MNKYIVTNEHPALKAGQIIVKINSLIILTHSYGYIKFTNKELNLWLELEFIKPYTNGEKHIELSMNAIEKAVCNTLRIHPLDLKSKKRTTTNAYSKRLFCYFAKTYSGNSMREIGEHIRAGYDHSTVHWAHKKISGLIDFDNNVTNDVNRMKKYLNLIR